MSQVNARLVYRNALRAMSRAGIDANTAVLSQSFLRFEVTLATNITSYRFGVGVNDSSTNSNGAVRATEQRLNLQDAFYCGSIQFFLGLASSATATDYDPITWNNPYRFSTAGAAQALNNLYQAQYQLTVNNRVISPALPMERHKCVPTYQQSITTIATATAGSISDAFDGINATAFACEPNWVLIGSKNNNFTLNLPTAVGTLQASSTTVVTCLLSGVLAQNVTPVV